MIDVGQINRERTGYKKPYLAVGISCGKDICVHLERAVRKQRGRRKKCSETARKTAKNGKLQEPAGRAHGVKKDAIAKINEPGDTIIKTWPD